MSVYQEFAQQIEERRRRLERRQFWFTVRRELGRISGFWLFALAMLVGAIVGILLAGALGAR